MSDHKDEDEEEKEESPTVQSKSSLETSEPNFYIFYVFNSNRHLQTEASEDSHTDLSSRSSSPDPNSSDTEEYRHCLSVIATNLGAELETRVRCFILKKLADKINQETERNYSFLTCISLEDKNTCGIHFYVLSKDSVSKADVGDSSKQLYLLCLLGPSESTLELFCPEIEKFCFDLLPLLDSEAIENENNLKLKLENWYRWCIEYVSRCASLLQEDISVILQLALCNGNIKIDSKEDEFIWDLNRILESCSLKSLLPLYTSNDQEDASVNNSSQWESISPEIPTATVTFDKMKPSLSYNFKCFPYCKQWADIFLSHDSLDSHGIRKSIENFKLKTVQDLNTLKRLLKKAENDYYSLYRAHKFLSSSGYKAFLLQHVKHEIAHSNSEEAYEVVTFLENYEG